MESYDVFLIGNFVALPAFIEKFGVPIPGSPTGAKVIEVKWQSYVFFFSIIPSKHSSNHTKGPYKFLVNLVLLSESSSRVLSLPPLVIVMLPSPVSCFSTRSSSSFSSPIPCPSFLQLKSWKEFHGAFSSPMPQHTVPRLCQFSSVLLQPKCCRCSGLLEVSLSALSHTSTTQT
jgi:hypothetical protein